jgi:hypothetical protein
MTRRGLAAAGAGELAGGKRGSMAAGEAVDGGDEKRGRRWRLHRAVKRATWPVEREAAGRQSRVAAVRSAAGVGCCKAVGLWMWQRQLQPQLLPQLHSCVVGLFSLV